MLCYCFLGVCDLLIGILRGPLFRAGPLIISLYVLFGLIYRNILPNKAKQGHTIL